MTDLDEDERALGSVEFVGLSVEGLEVLVAEHRTGLRADVLSATPATSDALATAHSQRLYVSTVFQDCRALAL